MVSDRAATDPDTSGPAGCAVGLYWIPLGAGDTTHCVVVNGFVFEAVTARMQRRSRAALFHSALIVVRDGQRFAIEMAPEWSGGGGDHGAVCRGPVGLPFLARSRMFRYEVRCSRDGVIPDLVAAVGGGIDIETDHARVTQLLELAPAFPTATWGRDEQGLGEMWNSNSLTSWLLASSGHDLSGIRCPDGGRAPGWSAGLAASGAPLPGSVGT